MWNPEHRPPSRGSAGLRAPVTVGGHAGPPCPEAGTQAGPAQVRPGAQSAELTLERPALELRAPRPEDLAAIAPIDRSWTQTDRRRYLEDRIAQAARGTAIDLSRVAEWNGEIVGFLFGSVTRGEFGRAGPIAWVDTVGVRSDQARRGVGSALLADFLRHARATGATRVWTLLDPDDEELTEFLETHGFSVAATKVVECALGEGTR